MRLPHIETWKAAGALAAFLLAASLVHAKEGKALSFNPQSRQVAETKLSGMLVEHTQALNTLVMSFIDMSEPLRSTRYQILAEFLKNSDNPKFLFIVYDERQMKELSGLILKAKPNLRVENIKFIKPATYGQSAWVRDFSPILYQGKNNLLNAITFNYVRDVDYAEDQALLIKALDVASEKSELLLDGGNLLADEAGRLYISSAAIENNLPENYTAEEVKEKKLEFERLLTGKMLATEVVWLPRVPAEYEATGHVDMYVRLLANKRAVVARSAKPEINRTLDQIAKIVESKGFVVTRLTANSEMVNRFRPENIFPSYTNSIIVGSSIFIPKYGVAEDAPAVKAYQELGYKVIQIAGESIAFGGSVHCLTYLYP